MVNLYLEKLNDSFTKYMPEKQNIIRDDILFNVDRVYIVQRINVPDTKKDIFYSWMTIVKPKMSSLMQKDFIKKRSKEKLETLLTATPTVGIEQNHTKAAFITKIPDYEKTQFYRRYIDIEDCNNLSKGIETLQNGRYVYFFQMER